MKLKKSIELPSGTLVPAGTELHFSTEGVGYYNGEEVLEQNIPEIATEGAGSVAVYNLQDLLKNVAKQTKLNFKIEPWENCYLAYDVPNKKLFLETFTWDTKVHVQTIDISTSTFTLVDMIKTKPVDWLTEPIPGAKYQGQAGDPGNVKRLLTKAINGAKKKYQENLNGLQENSIMEFMPKEALLLWTPGTLLTELNKRVSAEVVKIHRDRGPRDANHYTWKYLYDSLFERLK